MRVQSEENEIYFQQTKRIWDNAAKTQRLQGIDIEKSLRNFRFRLDEATYSEPRRIFSWSKVAAAAVVVIAVGIWIYSKEMMVLRSSWQQIVPLASLKRFLVPNVH
ncbi:hypothetical protein D3C85_1040980 [compost metagenome]